MFNIIFILNNIYVWQSGKNESDATSTSVLPG